MIKKTLLCLGLFLVACSASTPEPTTTSTPSETPTETPIPFTATPTKTRVPTRTPRPTTPPIANTISITGSGDDVVEIDKTDEPMLIRISGNSSGRHFAVTSYDSNGDYIDLLVNTTDPYDGVRPLDFFTGEHTAYLEINATGDWSIEIIDLLLGRSERTPGTIEGSGDEVVILIGGGRIANIVGNAASRHFAVIAYGDSRDLLVNTTDPYSGTVFLPSDVVLIEVTGVGDWVIEITD